MYTYTSRLICHVTRSIILNEDDDDKDVDEDAKNFDNHAGVIELVEYENYVGTDSSKQGNEKIDHAL